MAEHNIYTYKFCEMYKLYVAKAERKSRTKEEVDEVISWLTGYKIEELDKIDETIDMQTFFTNAPLLNPNRILIKGSICGVKISELEDSIMKEIRYLDKLIDELAKGKALDKVIRS